MLCFALDLFCMFIPPKLKLTGEFSDVFRAGYDLECDSWICNISVI